MVIAYFLIFQHFEFELVKIHWVCEKACTKHALTGGGRDPTGTRMAGVRLKEVDFVNSPAREVIIANLFKFFMDHFFMALFFGDWITGCGGRS